MILSPRILLPALLIPAVVVSAPAGDKNASVGPKPFSEMTDAALVTGDFAGAEFAGLRFRIYGKPGMLKDGEKYPLVLLLHGAGERGDDNESQLKHGAKAFVAPENYAAHPCFLIVPQCPKDGWWGGATLDRAQELLEAAAKRFPVDRKRIYVTGLSMGGFGTWELISRNPKFFAAAIPICGGGDPARVVAAKALPIRAFHGAADNTVPPQKTRDLIDALKKAGSKSVQYTEYPDVRHDSWTRTYGDPMVMDWLFAQKRRMAVAPGIPPDASGARRAY